MTSKEKAKEFIKKFSHYVDKMDNDYHYNAVVELQNAKACASIAIEEILNNVNSDLQDKYWNEVKEEILSFKILPD